MIAKQVYLCNNIYAIYQLSTFKFKLRRSTLLCTVKSEVELIKKKNLTVYKRYVDKTNRLKQKKRKS